MHSQPSPRDELGGSDAPPEIQGNSMFLLWNRYWFQPERPEPLAAFRILFGTYLLCYFGSFLSKVVLVFSNQGVVQPWFLPDWAIPSAAVAIALYAVLLLLIMLFILGCTTLLVTPVLLLFYLYFFLLNLAVKDTAYDRLNLIFLATACFAELDGAWALAPTFTKRPGQSRLVNPWATRLICLQLCLLYLGAGLWKLNAPQWHENEMMYWTLTGPWATPLSFWFVRLGLPMWFYGLIGWSVIAFELSAPFTLHFRSTVKATIIAGTLLHLGIAVFLNIPEFFNCVAAYALFWPDAELASVRDRIVAVLVKSPARAT